MTSLISLAALALVVALVWLIVGPPVIDRAADLETLRRTTTGKDRRP